MSLTYRTRRNLKRWLIALLTLVITFVLAFTLWVIWADRYVIYTRDGVVLDTGLSPTFPDATPAEPPAPGAPVSITVHDPKLDETTPVQQVSISGYYIDMEDLKQDIPGILEKLDTLPAGTAVMLDMKNTKGAFFYETSVGTTVSGAIDQMQMDLLLKKLSAGDLYAIARIPAFRDWEYGLNNVPQGLPRKGGGGALWMDDTNCYWLDPTSEEVMSYLIQITLELRSLGFDEVVFTDFRFPLTTKIKFEGDQDEAIGNAAATLAQACAKDNFFVSFCASDHQYRLPAGNCRLYLQDVDAALISETLQTYPVSNPAIRLLFLTEANDTRFNEYCVLRPLKDALQPLPSDEEDP